MARVARGWTCQRRAEGQRCGQKNESRKRKCEACGKSRPARRRPEHLAALDLDYAAFVRLNGGEFCAICKRGRGSRRLDRDHDHRTGRARGLLCARCNRALPNWMTADWLRAAAAYLERNRGGDTE